MHESLALGEKKGADAVAFLRISEARAAANYLSGNLSRKSADQLLTEEARSFSNQSRYDIFLSHAYNDGELILGVKKLIEDMGLTVYVDWIDDPKLDSSQRQGHLCDCCCLAGADASMFIPRLRSLTPTPPKSKWMPWELGYFDGFKPGHVWILPLVTNSDSEFEDQEYLGLYPPIEKLASLYGRQNLGFGRVGRANERGAPR